MSENKSIMEDLTPVFCMDCGNRVSWFDNEFGDEPIGLVCEDCKHEK